MTHLFHGRKKTLGTIKNKEQAHVTKYGMSTVSDNMYLYVQYYLSCFVESYI